MSTSILATKLYIPPPRPKVVLRPRLIERMNEGLQRKLTLISAPAGFGKTTLVSEWINDLRFTNYDLRESLVNEQTFVNPKSKIANRPVAWLSLGEGDNDPTHFLTYLVAALQTLALSRVPPSAELRSKPGREGIAPQIGTGVLGLLQSPQRPPVEAILTTLLNEITTIPENFVLILDDYHLIESKPVDQALTFLLDHLPAQMHLVITTREDPQIPLARYRARGQLTEVRATDLRFTPAEAADFLNQVMGLTLSVAEIAALESRTEGWVAGLQLAALALQGTFSTQGQQDASSFLKSFTGNHRFVLDYLVEEVLQQQPARVRTFLLQTSILDRLSGALCDAVTGQADGRALLATLERGNLFVIPLDDQREWYRYHHLFADVLQARALAEQPDHLPMLHQRASDWYEQHGLRGEAIRHALAAKDFARAAGLVELAWPAMDGRFQSATWLGWARALPDELVRARPVLNLDYAWALMNGGELEAAEARFGDAERWLDTSPERSERPETPSIETWPEQSRRMVIVDEEQFRNLPASIATARAYLAQARGDLPGSVKYGRRALDLLPAGDHLRRGPAAALLGLAHWASGDLEAAYRALADAMTGFQKVGNLHFATSVISGLADIRMVQGRLREAVRCYTQALQLVLAQHPEGTRPLIRGTANLYLGLSELTLEQGNLEVASQHLLRSEELGDQAGLPDWRYRLCRAQARFKETQGDLAGALDRLDEAERHARRTPVPDVRPLAALKTRVWLAQGRLREALRWVQEQGLSVDDELSFLRECEHITLARVLIANRALPDALRLLERLQQAAEAGERMGSVIEILLLLALAHAAQGNMSPALAALKRALTLAEPEGYVRLFVDEGLPMARLLSAAAQGMMPDYIEKLLAAFSPGEAEAQPRPGGTRDKADLPPASPAQPLIEPLSAREVEVLQLIAQGLSNGEISARLFLALSTVKGHNRNIFGKLQVQRRTEAIARARALGLL